MVRTMLASHESGVARPAGLRVAVVIPALDEEASLPFVLKSLEGLDQGAGSRPFVVRPVVVVDNGSRDRTAEVAAAMGALVVSEPRRGYGRAVLAGLTLLRRDPPDVVAFLDADFSDDPARLHELVEPIAAGETDLVLGSRTLGAREPGAQPLQARIGNRIAVSLIRLLHGRRFTDLGPFRAVRWDAFVALGMRDTGYGWTVEMQVKAVRAGLRVREIPVPYRRRVGRSKISGTLRGTILAGGTILWTVVRLRFAPALSRARGSS